MALTTGAQVRAARALLRMEQEQLAETVGVAVNTIRRIESFDGQWRDFYFRQLRDGKGSIDPDQIVPEGAVGYGRLCAQALALAHARSGDRIAISSYLGTNDVFDRAMADFAVAYADQNDRDYAAAAASLSSAA